MTHLLSKVEVPAPPLRIEPLTVVLVAEGQLTGAIRIPNTVSPFTVTVDIRAAQVTGSFTVSAPTMAAPRHDYYGIILLVGVVLLVWLHCR